MQTVAHLHTSLRRDGIAVLAALSWLSLLAGCGGGGGSTIGILCILSNGQLVNESSPQNLKDCCGPDGKPLVTTAGGGTCPTDPSNQNAGVQLAGALNIVTAAGALQQAATLAGEAPNSRIETPTLLTSAATAGGRPSSGQPQGGAALAGGPAKNPGGGGGDSDAAAITPSGGSKGLDSSSGSVAAAKSSASAEIMASLSSGSGRYSGGGRGSVRSGGKSMMGSGTEGPLSAGLQDINYRKVAASETAAAIDDPEDYFGRIDVFSNLFKVVEKRYRSKAVDWEKSRLRLH